MYCSQLISCSLTIRTDAQNQQQGIETVHQQLGDAQRRIGLLEIEANRLQTAEIGALKRNDTNKLSMYS